MDGLRRGRDILLLLCSRLEKMVKVGDAERVRESLIAGDNVGMLRPGDSPRSSGHAATAHVTIRLVGPI